MWDGVEDRSMMAHGKINGWWELTTRFNETWWIRGHGTFGAYEERGLLKTHALIFKSTKLTTQDKIDEKEKDRKPLRGPWLRCYAKAKP
jgi:hypothetical protein